MLLFFQAQTHAEEESVDKIKRIESRHYYNDFDNCTLEDLESFYSCDFSYQVGIDFHEIKILPNVTITDVTSISKKRFKRAIRFGLKF